MNVNIKNIPIITIDGPTASGKGTIARKISKYLGFNYLDSGALYRLIALITTRHGIMLNNESILIKIIENLYCHFNNGHIYVANEDVTQAIRTEEIGNIASKIATVTNVRQSLYKFQLGFCKAPGLVADGRDMGSVIFSHALLKIYLTATLAVRSKRRYKQLINKGFSIKMVDLIQDLKKRDTRDIKRTLAPLKFAEGAYLLDTSDISTDDAVKKILNWWYVRLSFLQYKNINTHNKL